MTSSCVRKRRIKQCLCFHACINAAVSFYFLRMLPLSTSSSLLSQERHASIFPSSVMPMRLIIALLTLDFFFCLFLIYIEPTYIFDWDAYMEQVTYIGHEKHVNICSACKKNAFRNLHVNV